MATSQPPPSLFRPSKKRKIYRQRATSSIEQEPPSLSPPTPQTQAQSLDELISSAQSEDVDISTEATEVSMAEILRLRKRNKRGVEFRAESSGNSRGEEGGRALVVRSRLSEEGAEEVGLNNGGPRKFAPQTGAVGDVNKYMMAYIDSEIAKRRAESSQVATSLPTASNPRFADISTNPLPNTDQSKDAQKGVEVQRQPATIGRLLEIDLGDEARDRNVERTNQARRRLDGEEVKDKEEDGEKKVKKARLGRDGKPWRGRKRRGSEDVKRDKLVEEVLRENRLEIYDEPITVEADDNPDQAADDRIAEAFRKEFMDSVNERAKKKTGPPPPSRAAAGKKQEEELKGPKLGGSRNARAAMRDSMLKGARK